jgi:hypothetical protein
MTPDRARRLITVAIGLLISGPVVTSAQPPPAQIADTDSEARRVAAALSQLAMQDQVITPQQVAAVLRLPLAQFQWLGETTGGWTGGWMSVAGPFKAQISYRGNADTERHIEAPWRTSYVSVVVQISGNVCLSASGVAAAIGITGVPWAYPPRLPPPLPQPEAGGPGHSGPPDPGRLAFQISSNAPIKKQLSLDATCPRVIWIHKEALGGEDLPVWPNTPQPAD